MKSRFREGFRDALRDKNAWTQVQVGQCCQRAETNLAMIRRKSQNSGETSDNAGYVAGLKSSVRTGTG